MGDALPPTPGVGGVGLQSPQDDDLLPERHDSKLDHSESFSAAALQSTEADNASAAESQAQNAQAITHNAALSLDTSMTQSSLPHRGSRLGSPARAGLQVKTNLGVPTGGTSVLTAQLRDTPTIQEDPVALEPGTRHNMTSPTYFPAFGSSLRSAISTSSIGSSMSLGSTFPSPYLASLSDLTPLPSPMVGLEISGPAHRTHSRPSTPSRSRAGSLDDATPLAKLSSSGSQRKRKGYGSLLQGAVETSAANAVAFEGNARTGKQAQGHGRHRSISEFTPEQLHNVRPRHVTLGGVGKGGHESQDRQMQREAFVAPQRGVVARTPSESDPSMPTPPASNASAAGSDEADEDPPFLENGTASEYLSIHCGIHHKRQQFRQLRQLGQGTFSIVMLATRERGIPAHPPPDIETRLDPNRLVAVKIIEHGPAGGADEQRIETGLRREVEMLKSVTHPSLVHIKACEYQATRTLLVLTYCPGGDLFELASQHRDALSAQLIQRMFAELVAAVQYLHDNWIVHRDIKLENVLVNIRPSNLSSLVSPLTHPTPIVTLTDLGLSRRIPKPPESPLLQTRCGSEDYAAPEILLGQPYDGRSTDAWALGVLLYALMEGRLPFDAPPGKSAAAGRNTHRIARCDWIWCRFGDEDGEWDENTRGAAEFEGARRCVEGLLKKVRMGRLALKDVEAMEWVRSGIAVPGGLKIAPDDEDAL